MTDKSKLDAIRKRIDELDDKLIKLINKRAALAKEVGAFKKDNNEPYYRPEREAQILRRVVGNNEGPLSDDELARLFREIISACLALEQPLRIAYLGPEGTFTQTAALKHFGHSVTTVADSGIDQVFRDVQSGACHFGVVPVENSIEGVVNHTLDMLINSNLKICGEVELKIHQYLMSNAERIEDISKVYSHQQSLAQCRRWLDNHLLEVERIPVASNAEAARLAGREKHAAAIAGESAADYYNLSILVRNVEDEPDNTTRFLVLGRYDTGPSGNDKTSLLFSMPSKPGALLKMLACFSENDVNMTRIESRPSRRGMWKYIFFVDVEGHIEDKAVAAAVKQLQAEASMVKLLGSYPKSVL